MRLLFIFALLFVHLVAQDKYSLRLEAGQSSASDFDQLYTFKGFNTSPYNTKVYGIDGGYELYNNLFTLPLDIYLKAGLSYFDENYHQKDFLEGTFYIKMYYSLEALGYELRIGIAEGVSYAHRVPYVEAREAIEENDNQSNFLNYMEITFDIDLGKITHQKYLDEVYLGYLIKHRSGFHGAYGGVSDGGSNYNCLYVEKNF
ncbi:hypothetical protein GJV85_11450 [Sulfurimonas aquatica]|uniref:Uncharacterized protein n=1 Tax=Sulfurimonas aquatica TaxID=2672570 RepID=A0A975B214_9BACT|nr:hypothetical protein [Sulfurimonas aquatica]QSZ42700.1 hypothetical protein GJV85_11450 [Sulfurimonas aquatica]